MTIECYVSDCPFHSCHYSNDGPFCDEVECHFSNADMDEEAKKKLELEGGDAL